MQSPADPSAFEPWWGDFEVAPGTVGAWRVGPLRLWIQHLAAEWRLSWHGSDDPLDSTVRVVVPGEGPAAPTAPGISGVSLHVTRYAAPGESSRVSLIPRLADRGMVIRPEDTFHIPAGSEVTP